LSVIRGKKTGQWWNLYNGCLNVKVEIEIKIDVEKEVDYSYDFSILNLDLNRNPILRLFSFCNSLYIPFMETRTIFLVDLDAFFASVEEARNPALKQKPVCIGGNAHERGVVACPNYLARKHGVRTAMPLRSAAVLLKDTDAIFLRGNMKLYSEYSKKVFDILYDFTPDIQPMSLDEAYCDVTECLHLWNRDPETMARAMKERVKKELSITLSVGIASNKVCAKIACDLGKPDGLLLVPTGGEAEFLAPLPVEKLPGVGKKTHEKLLKSGIHTIGDMARTPEDRLMKLFGAVGAHLHRNACGIDRRDVHEPEDEKSISRATTFEADTHDREFIESVLFYLVERCCRTLRRRNVAALTISVFIRFSDFTHRNQQYTRQEATNIEEDVFGEVQKLLPKVLHAGKAVRLVGIGLSNFVPVKGQSDLFGGHPSKHVTLRQTMDTIREKYGYQIITVGRTAELKKRFKETKDGYELHTASQGDHGKSKK
jgi:DNA polymerase IV